MNKFFKLISGNKVKIVSAIALEEQKEQEMADVATAVATALTKKLCDGIMHFNYIIKPGTEEDAESEDSGL